MKNFELKSKPNTVIELEPLVGSNIDDCKVQAKEIAKMLSGNVQFDHNGRVYLTDWHGNMVELKK